MNKKILLVFLYISLSECFIFDNKFNLLKIIKYKNIKNKIELNNKKIYKKFILKNNKIPKLVRYIIHNNLSLKDAELKHGRIAILAVIGRYFAEIIHPVLALNLYSKNLLINKELVPSFFNGGMNNIHSIFYIFCIFYIFIIELNHLIIMTDITNKINTINTDNIVVKTYNNLTYTQQNLLSNLEINYGRLSMFLSSWFTYYELVAKNPIIYSLDLIFFIALLIFTTLVSIFT